jgi:hypothetical protein
MRSNHENLSVAEDGRIIDAKTFRHSREGGNLLKKMEFFSTTFAGMGLAISLIQNIDLLWNINFRKNFNNEKKNISPFEYCHGISLLRSNEFEFIAAF